MKTASILVSLMLALSATAAPQFGKGFKGKGGGRKGGAGAVAGGAAAGAAGGAAAGAAAAGGAPPPVASAVNNGAGNDASAASASVAAPVASAVATAGANGTDSGNNGNGGNGNANNGNNNAGAGAAAGGNADAQSSLTLDPAVIAKGFANDGQDVPTEGQVASLTSTNNFINFCLTVPNLPLTDGKQITSGSCNPAPIGTIPSTDNMPSAKFVSPVNNDNFDANTAFTITMAITNLETGNFVNAQENYFSAPQQVNPSSGQIIGHSHVTIDPLDSITSTTPTDPKGFVFFKGINGAAVNGQVTADVDKGLPAGAYRLCSINSSSNHQPVIVPVAQHGSLDDCVYFTVGGAGGGNANAGGNGNAAGNATAAGNANAGGNANANGGAQAGAGAGQGGKGNGN